MNGPVDPGLQVLFSFFEHLHRKAPGSEASTRRAFSLLKNLTAGPRIVDFGCGSGASALVLAGDGADVTAIDIHPPFLDDLQQRAMAAGCAHRVHTVCCDMANPPFADRTFDVVWSEGALYLIGFRDGLRRWRSLLNPGGHLAISEAAWLVDKPPQAAIDFWNASGAQITSREENRATICETGYELVGDFTLPQQDWADYYDPLQQELHHFRRDNIADTKIQEFADSMQREVDLWYDYGDSYGYVFYVARAK